MHIHNSLLKNYIQHSWLSTSVDLLYQPLCDIKWRWLCYRKSLSGLAEDM